MKKLWMLVVLIAVGLGGAPGYADEPEDGLVRAGAALRANNDETSTPRKFTLEGDR